MRGRLWLNYFTEMIVAKRQDKEYPVEPSYWRDAEWTEFMRKVMDSVGEKMNCRVVRLRPDDKERSGEYLNIDAVFIDEAEYDLVEKEKIEWDPFVLPRAVVELENSSKSMKISYCLWKILCVRAPIRVLICSQSNKDEVITLKEYLERVIWRGSLIKGTEGDLLVIIGDESVSKSWAPGVPWGEYYGKYFSVFEWRNDRLEKIEGLKW